MLFFFLSSTQFLFIFFSYAVNRKKKQFGEVFLK